MFCPFCIRKAGKFRGVSSSLQAAERGEDQLRFGAREQDMAERAAAGPAPGEVGGDLGEYFGRFRQAQAVLAVVEHASFRCAALPE